MNRFEFTKSELEYLRDIHKILKFSEFPKLFYVIGYDKTTGKRKIFLFHTENKDGDEYTYAIAEILSDENQSIDNTEFQFSQERSESYNYGPKKPWWKFWSRLTER